jgi:hypothetical protein
MACLLSRVGRRVGLAGMQQRNEVLHLPVTDGDCEAQCIIFLTRPLYLAAKRKLERTFAKRPRSRTRAGRFRKRPSRSAAIADGHGTFLVFDAELHVLARL